MDTIILWINHYGYIMLFLVVMLEMLALPISGQATMAYCGFLVWQGRLSWGASIGVAGTAASIGMTTAYWIGKTVGAPFFLRYGHHIHLSPTRMKQVSGWLDKHFKVTATFAYYIPGVRHFIGYLSGTSGIPFIKFATYIYIGAFLWAIIFVSLGRLLGHEWKYVDEVFNRYVFIGILIIIVGTILIYLFRNRGSKKSS